MLLTLIKLQYIYVSSTTTKYMLLTYSISVIAYSVYTEGGRATWTF